MDQLTANAAGGDGTDSGAFELALLPPLFSPPILGNTAGGRANNLGANIGDPAICIDPGGLVGIVATVTNPNNVSLAASFTANLVGIKN